MKKLLLNRKPVNGPWGGGNLFVKAIVENAEKYGYEIVYKLEKGLDAILMIDPRYDGLGISANEISTYKFQNPKTRVVHRVNECDARKGTSEMDEMIVACSKFTDATVFVSNWIKEYFETPYKYNHPIFGMVTRKGGPLFGKERYVVYNGVNHNHFCPNQKKGFITQDYHVTKIIAHHWSNNTMKGFDIYDKLDAWIADKPWYKFVYVGRHQNNFKNTTIVDPIFGKALGEELSWGDVYVSASRFDPGPNHIIEALACELPTFVHSDGGGSVEFAGLDAQYSSFEELILRIEKREYPSKRGWGFSWENCAKSYFEIISGKMM